MDFEGITSLPVASQIRILLAALETIAIATCQARSMLNDFGSLKAIQFLQEHEHDTVMIKDRIITLIQKSENNMKKYFIDIVTYTPVNKLDEQIQRAFLNEFQHRLIEIDQLSLLKALFETVCKKYRDAGGRATMEYRDYNSSSGSMRVYVCKGEKTSMYIDLTPTRGPVLRE